MPSPLLLLLLLLLLLPPSSSLLPPSSSLLLLKSSFTNPNPNLSSWNSSTPTPPCNWPFLLCSAGIITGLRLRHLNLSGTVNIRALTNLPSLRTISLTNNSLSGPIPDFSLLPALKSLYLSHNRFSGPIPARFFAPMNHLKKLWIDDNNFTGPIPLSLTEAKSLLELHVEDNGFEGGLPDLDLPLLRSFNASNNGLSGRVPGYFARFGAAVLEGNEGLCVGRSCGAPAPAPVVSGGGGGGVVGYVVGAVVVLVLVVVGFAAVKRRGKVGGGVDGEKTAVSVGRKKNEDGSIGGSNGGLVEKYGFMIGCLYKYCIWI